MPESRFKLPSPPWPPRLPQWPQQEPETWFLGERRPPLIPGGKYGPQLDPEFSSAYGREQSLKNLEKASRRIEEIYRELGPVYDAVKYNIEGWSDARTAVSEALSNLGTATVAVKDEIRKLRAQRR